MTASKKIPADSLVNCCNPEQFDFKTTAELDDLTEIIGQARAVKAVHFGINIRREGYNLYVMGPSGIGKHSMVRQYLEQKAGAQNRPDDWCYINNFEQPHKPHALRLPHGRGNELSQDMEQLIEELSTALPATFESEEYRNQIQALEEELKEQQEHAFSELAEAAAKQDIKLFRTPSGFAFAPLRNDEVVNPEEFDKLPKEEQERLEQIVANLQEQLQTIIQHIPLWRKETREKVKKLNREMAMTAVGHLIAELKKRYADLPPVLEYLDTVEQDIVDNVKDFLKLDEVAEGYSQQQADPKTLHRYKVNNLVMNNRGDGAPVVYLDNPTYLNLVGRAEHMAQFGTLVTDFTLLKPGALHQANGGYLLVDAHKLLTHPYAWEGLKRALYSSQVNIEPLEKMLSLASTVSLEPEPIPLDIKVVILGDRLLYYLLQEYDPDFSELFKVQADFEEQIARNSENNLLLARMIATLIRKEELLPFHRDAVAQIIDYASRHVEDAEKLTTHMRSIADLLRESDYWARQEGRDVVRGEDIRHTIDEQLHRASRVREHIQESIQRGDIFIDSEGESVGQVNGLSVLTLGNHMFGQPSRITATVHIGEGNVVDIEREVEMSGPIHSKGVLILSSFIASRYAQKHPLSLSASLVFEQNYGGIDGDSASLAELCALLSAICGVSIKQSFAITGSVNQHGQVQPIGGVNEKIEGFFEVCRTRGLDGQQGVIIPAANTKNLMLHPDVVSAVREGKFSIYAVESVDQALSLLTGVEAGESDVQGNYPDESLNGKVQARLREMALIRQQFGDHHKDKDDGDGEKDEQEAD
ncbi:MAG: AAA family ATPase [Gammaproteobacteria bacterium]|nr:AAA family ATPase [Gammaproteobacteria bacterium]MCW8957570.1 AAA family ATPase [Gammaproteobacteria bacterium]MCW8992060.1 AAA family ATPase [Gammaproteobacteria bacterium]